MNSKIFFFILSMTLFSSCSFFLQNMDKDILSENQVTPLDTTLKRSCDIIQKRILMNDNEQSQKSFNLFVTKLSKKIRLSFIDKSVLWSLLQMNLRPDLSSPSAKMQVFLNINNKEKYFSSFTKSSHGYPYFFLLEGLLKEYKSKHTLKSLSLLYDKYFTYHLYVSHDLEVFLNENKNKILKSKLLKRHYIRGDDPLRENERLNRVKITPLVNNYLKTKRSFKYKISNHLFSYNKESTFIPQCNFDMSLYKDSVFLIHEHKVKSHTFGLKNNTNVFLATSNQNIEKLKPLHKTTLFQGVSNTRSASMCSFRNKFKSNNTLWLASSNSRDPGQHLFNVMEYGLNTINTIKELDNMLLFPRHQFLKDPTRLIIESRRSSAGQLEQLLKLNIPIYNSKKVGKILGYMSNTQKASFVLDAREQGHLECTSL